VVPERKGPLGEVNFILPPICLGPWISGPSFSSSFATRTLQIRTIGQVSSLERHDPMRTELPFPPSEPMNNGLSRPSSKCTTKMVTRQTCIRSDVPSNQLSFRPYSTVLCTYTSRICRSSLLKSNCRNASYIKQLQNMLPKTSHRLAHLLKHLTDWQMHCDCPSHWCRCVP
jgi:hypothetical protein